MPDRRTAAAFALIGLLAGVLLVAFLTTVAGPAVTVGLGWLWRDGSRGYPDRLIDTGAAHPSLLPLVPVALVAGVLAGLIVVVALRFLRGSRPLVWPIAGAAAGALLAIGLHLWRWDGSVAQGTVVYHGLYIPLNDSASAYGSRLVIVSDVGGSWWPLVVAGVLGGLVVGSIGALCARERVSVSPSPSG